MRTLEQLIDHRDPALPLILDCAKASAHDADILAPSTERAAVLTWLQVTTRSHLGSVAYDTGGIVIDGGWLRILGCGHDRLTRNLRDWNFGRSAGYLLVADDAVGGFFALNGGSLGECVGTIYYWAPDTLAWESLDMGYGDFLTWTFTERLARFYEGLRWQGWQADCAALGTDQCFNFYPFLWTAEGSVQDSTRGVVNVAARWSFMRDLVEQLRAEPGSAYTGA